MTYSLDGENYTAQPVLSGLAPGAYTLFIRNELGCVFTEEALVPEAEELLADLPETLNISLGDSSTIRVQTSAADSLRFQWTPAEGLDCPTCAEVVARPFESTLYTVLVTDAQGCTAEASIQIIVDRSPRVYIPNGFSPNNDGINDLFQVFVDPGLATEVLRMQVFDRWGELLYDETDLDPLSEGWDGSFRGKPVQSGVYVYVVEVGFVDGTSGVFKGDVTVVR